MSLNEVLSRRVRTSVVYMCEGFVHKAQPKYLTDNEWWALDRLRDTGYVPRARLYDLEVIRMEGIKSEPITDKDTFMSHYRMVLDILKHVGIRHGDLSLHAVIPRGNIPIIIDWAESRMWDDSRPDKRREGDAFWLRQTMEALCAHL